VEPMGGKQALLSRKGALRNIPRGYCSAQFGGQQEETIAKKGDGQRKNNTVRLFVGVRRDSSLENETREGLREAGPGGERRGKSPAQQALNRDTRRIIKRARTSNQPEKGREGAMGVLEKKTPEKAEIGRRKGEKVSADCGVSRQNWGGEDYDELLRHGRSGRKPKKKEKCPKLAERALSSSRTEGKFPSQGGDRDRLALMPCGKARRRRKRKSRTGAWGEKGNWLHEPRPTAGR